MAFFQTSVPPKKGVQESTPGGCETAFQKPTDLHTPEISEKTTKKQQPPFFDNNWVMIYFLKNPTPMVLKHIYVNFNVGPGKKYVNLCLS